MGGMGKILMSNAYMLDLLFLLLVLLILQDSSRTHDVMESDPYAVG